jgi:DNA ligase 1
MPPRHKLGIDLAILDAPVGLFCFELMYADGEDLPYPRLPYPRRRVALEAALTLAVAAAAADHRRRGRRSRRAGCDVRRALTDGFEGLVCESAVPDSA